jgi:hypothetical protein
MENPVQILTPPAGVVSGLFDVFFAFVTGPASIPVAGGTVSPADCPVRLFSELKIAVCLAGRRRRRHGPTCRYGGNFSGGREQSLFSGNDNFYYICRGFIEQIFILYYHYVKKRR